MAEVVHRIMQLIMVVLLVVQVVVAPGMERGPVEVATAVMVGLGAMTPAAPTILQEQ